MTDSGTGTQRIACAVEYDGVRFRGWQRQRDHVRTVQAALEQALSAVADEPVRTVCAGRTDAGVHATGQVVHFDTHARRPEKAWVMGTNSHLPADVAVRWASPVPDEFHARFSVVERRYRYVIVEGMSRPALWRGRAAWSTARLSIERMREAARLLEGEHDFSAFRSAQCQAPNPVRTVHQVSVQRTGECALIDVRANAFLHNMVRIIAGTLMSVGSGERDPDWVARVLESRDRTAGAATAPARGLYFVGPVYPERFGLPPRPQPPWAGAAI